MALKTIITGGSTGIGRATAIAMAKSGYDVAITYATGDQEAKQTQQMVEAEGRRCVVKKLDLTHPETANPCVDEMVDELGGLDVVVSNAGVMVDQKMPNIDRETTNRIFNINTFGAIQVIQRAVHHMLPGGMDGEARETPGRVIVVTSVHEVIANPGDTLYTMTKHALGGLVKCLALDLSPLNITVNAVAPGEIATPMNDMEPSHYDDTKRPAIPIRRTGHPQEIASVIRFLASDEAGFVTGVRWPVDGGFEAATPLAASGYRDAYLSK
ncbi:3-oxoacyl-[acyl-carrier-protein] reductase FabG [Rubripirellula obstinata]|uniref:3-oxoacyl-[acyl-carrier-protein] reductase FabG n=1 Tax=Rubripirellula obstinata TaxID=406547 RepID=A0A5B1CNE9_9BACT|nr:SDR family oxidoreductase [Rubripirellula obstinata]KAA1261465.1 3-oxoacyl-[acyl-carrier-protein] reductase FabG [Rubripirellula obstinata]